MLVIGMSQRESEQAGADEPGGPATATAPAKKPKPPKRKPEQLPPYKVLLHNDEVSTFDHVIRSIVRLTSLGEQQALLRTIEAHENGVALLLMTHRERAELYCEQFTSLKISVTMEPAEA